jgi:hypothetical protein
MHTTRAPDAVFLVRPCRFGFNPETAESNRMQRLSPHSNQTLQQAADAEFLALQATLEAAGVRCCVIDDESPPTRPDAIFPNNWISFHDDGTVVLYPMLAPSRRLERRPEIIPTICRELGFEEKRRLDLSDFEQQGLYLEGTGSLVLDHAQRLAFACRSPRTADVLVQRWSQSMKHEPVLFDATDEKGQPYYHTNVMLWIGTHCAMVCAEAIAPAQRDAVRARLAVNRALIEIDWDAVNRFAGNMLELAGRAEGGQLRSLLLMSETAAQVLTPPQRQQLASRYDQLLIVAVPTIEAVGGGSVRCMVAEVPRPDEARA